MATSHITPSLRLLLLLILSFAMLFADHRSNLFGSIRIFTSSINVPFQTLLNLPSNTRAWIMQNYPDDTQHQKYAELLEKQIKLEVRVQRYDALQAENQRLLKLLSVAEESVHRSMLAEIIEIGLPPLGHRVALNRGVKDGVYVGQPALTAQGVLGQVTELSARHCVVTLVTAPNHAIPVQIQRNGLRTIAQGSNVSERITMPFLHSTADIRDADILVTSGVGQKFPSGFKVAQVNKIIADASQKFLTVHASPFVRIEMTKEVLLLWNEEANKTTETTAKNTTNNTDVSDAE